MSLRFKTVLFIALGLLVMAVAFLVMYSLTAQNPLRVRVTKVIPEGAYTVLRLEVRNDSRQSVMVFTRWGVYETGAIPAHFGGISTDSLEDLVPKILHPGDTFSTGATVVAPGKSGVDHVYCYQWEPAWQTKLEGYWWRVRSMVAKSPGSVSVESGRRGIAEIVIPKAP